MRDDKSMDLSLVTAVVEDLFQGAFDPRELVAKMGPDAADVHAPGPMSKKKALRYLPNQSKKVTKGIGTAHKLFTAAEEAGRARLPGDKKFFVRSVAAASAAGGGAGGYYAGQKRTLKRINNPKPPVSLRTKAKEMVSKNDLTWTGEISKINEEKRQVFGWCSLSKVDGEPVIDRQNDYIPIEETEAAAYTYVLESRKGGDMHKRKAKTGVSKGWDEPLHTADMIESFVVTPEKLVQMGLAPDALPLGWWVGFKINDDEQWEMVKRGERTGFSVHGSGRRTPVGA